MRNPFAVPWVALRGYIAAVRYAIPGVMIIEEKEEEEPDSSDRGRGESDQKRENLGEIPEGRGAGGGRGKRESMVHRGGEGQTGKMREVIRRNGAKEFSVVRLRSTKRERKRGRGWELNGAGS